MNIRIPETFQAVPTAVQALPQSLGRPRLRLIAGIAGVLLLAALAWWIFGGTGAHKHETPPPPVRVSTIGRKDVTIIEHTVGTVVANATVSVTSRVQGELMKAFFKEGDVVEAGKPLFQIDPRPYRAAYDNALATLGAAKAKWDRYARLLAQKAVASQDADDAKAAYLVAKANADTARLNLDFTTIRAPLTGKTGPMLIQPGNQVTASGSNQLGATGTTGGSSANAVSSNGSASALVVITQVQPVKLSFFLPQSDLPSIQARQANGGLTAIIDNHSGTLRRAPVDFTGNIVTANTGTIELRATVPNSDDALVPGQLVDVGVTLNTLAQAMVVPRDAVNEGPNGRYVYVVGDGRRAVMQPVSVLYDDGVDMAIRGAVKPGMRVVTDGQMRVAPGQPVTIDSGGPAKKAVAQKPA